MSTTSFNNEESIVGVEVLSFNIILLNGLWLLTEWSLNLIEATSLSDFSFIFSKSLVLTIVANETIFEESQKSIVLVTLFDGNSSPLIWSEFSTG